MDRTFRELIKRKRNFQSPITITYRIKLLRVYTDRKLNSKKKIKFKKIWSHKILYNLTYLTSLYIFFLI